MLTRAITPCTTPRPATPIPAIIPLFRRNPYESLSQGSRVRAGQRLAAQRHGPGLFIFQTKGTTPSEYANNNDNFVYAPGRQQTKVWRCLKVPVSWIVDGVEVWSEELSDQLPEALSDHNGHCGALGTPLYRNVDKTATEALPENAGKLIYNYTLAVDEAANGDNVIDAEASIRKGAHILYLDDNNSSTDFHERQHFSLRHQVSPKRSPPMHSFYPACSSLPLSSWQWPCRSVRLATTDSPSEAQQRFRHRC